MKTRIYRPIWAMAEGDPGGGAPAAPPADPPAAESFVSTLPEAYQSHAALQDIKDMDGLLSSYVNAQAMIGDSLRIPGEDASPEDWSAFNEKFDKVPGMMRVPDDADEATRLQALRKLGAKDSADKYIISRPEAPPGYQPNQELEGKIKEKAHELGLSQTQLDGMTSVFYADEFADASVRETARAAELNGLKNDWGNAFPQRMAMAEEVIQMFGDESTRTELTDAIGKIPGIARLLGNIGARFSEAKIITGTTQANIKTTEQVQASINEIIQNLQHPYHIQKDPGHEAARQKVQALYAQLADAQGGGI